MTSQSAAAVNRRNAPAQITRSGLGRLIASQPTNAAHRAATTAATAGSAITSGDKRPYLQSCRRFYRRDRGGDDVIHGGRAVQTRHDSGYLSPLARPGTFPAGGTYVRGKLD